MLFDLRGPGRKNVVRVVYLFLAVIMVAGLVLVGVGTGTGGGGLLNAFTNSGSGNNQNDVVNQATKKALKQTRKHPQSTSAWAGLVQARWSAANSGGGAGANSTFTKAGKKQLKLGITAWDRYLKLANEKPTLTLSVLAARMYQGVDRYADASGAWQFAAQTQPAGSVNALNQYFCMALNSYAGGLSAKATLANAQTMKLAPKVRRPQLKQVLDQAKSSTATAKQAVAADC